MPSWISAEYLIYPALIWLIVEGAVGFRRYRAAGQNDWARWVIANTFAGAMLLLAALTVVLDDGMVLLGMCLASALIAHLLEQKFRPDQKDP